MGHLLTRTGAACLEFVGPGDSEVDAERWCEQFAASFLLPAKDLRRQAIRQGAEQGSKVDDPKNLISNGSCETGFRLGGRTARGAGFGCWAGAVGWGL